MDQVGITEQVAKEAQARVDAGPAHGLRYDVQVLDLQEVSRLGAPYVNRPREGMYHPPGDVGYSVHISAKGYLAVGGVPGLEDHLFTWIYFQHRCHIRVPAVVTRVRLVL